MWETSISIWGDAGQKHRMYPDDIALVERIPDENRRQHITWKQFDERANRFAHVLSEKGIWKGDRVVHLMMNSID